MELDSIDEIDCGNFFDQIEDLIDFSPENESGGGDLVNSGHCKDFPSMWNADLPEMHPVFPGSHVAAAPDLSADLFVPYEDIVQLEWLSTFVEESFSSGGMTIGKDMNLIKEPSQNHFQTSSPVSVLESSSSSSSSCSGEKTIPIKLSHPHTQRARSKRPRPITFSPRNTIQLISPSSSFIETPKPFASPGFSSEAENFADSPSTKKTAKPVGSDPKRKKKIKHNLPVNPAMAQENPLPLSVRKCLHCEITKTPQWRAGPLGPKTLCNACGVRHKSGRLFPEYRPAASPTFVPSLHSNSHKKVIEMRSKATSKCIATAFAATIPMSPKPEFTTPSGFL